MSGTKADNRAVRRLESGQALASLAQVADVRWLRARLPSNLPRSLFFPLRACQFAPEW